MPHRYLQLYPRHISFVILISGSPARRTWEEAKERAQGADQVFDVKPPQPIGWRAFREFWPKDIVPDTWRSCACLICVEVESLLSSYGELMSSAHEARLEADGAKVRGDMSRKLRTRCTDTECVWTRPDSDPLSLPLPHPWPSRLKNIIAKPAWATGFRSTYTGPRLFCQDSCGCGCCVAERKQLDDALGIIVEPDLEDEVDLTRQEPHWLRCRLSKCSDCGWDKKYPRCPTLVNMIEEVSFRPLDSARQYLEWIRNGREGEPPARRPSGKVDQLTAVSAPAAVG